MRLHWNSGDLWPACGSLSYEGVRFANDPLKVTCQRCKKSPHWRSFAERDRALKETA